MEDQEPYTIDPAALKVSPKQLRAIVALLEEPTLKKAAATAGVNPSTLWRWLKTTDFRHAYMLARWKAVQQGIARCQRFTAEATSVLNQIMRDESVSASTRISAAKSIVQNALRGVELEDHDERLAQIQRDIETLKADGRIP